MMYPEIERGTIAVPAATQALDALSALAQRYGDVLRSVMPADQFLPLSKKAAIGSVDG